MSTLEERRQAAREAAYEAVAQSTSYYQTRAAVEAAVASATQVTITGETTQWVADQLALRYADGRSSILELLTSVFEAAGFEVIEDLASQPPATPPAVSMHRWQRYNEYGNTCHHPDCRLSESEHLAQKILKKPVDKPSSLA